MKIPQLFGMIPRNTPTPFTPQYKVDLFKIKKADVKHLLFSAEREGFEPPEPRSSTVFKTAAIDHSATSPIFFKKNSLSVLESVAKVKCFFESTNLFHLFL